MMMMNGPREENARAYLRTLSQISRIAKQESLHSEAGGSQVNAHTVRCKAVSIHTYVHMYIIHAMSIAYIDLQGVHTYVRTYNEYE